MENMERFFRQHSQAINITANVLLVVLCGISYVSLLALYLTQGMGTESLMFVDRGSLPPTTAVPLLGVLLTGATSALLTRSVEHSVWIRLLGGEPDLLPTKSLTTDEIHQRSQWSVSPLARLLYVFRGHSWPLRMSGLLLFANAILNPILLYGVRPKIVYDETTTTIPQRDSYFSGFIPGFDEEIGQDNRMMLASLVSMNNLSAPVANVCNDASCSAMTRAQALGAECMGFDLPQPTQEQGNVTICSAFGNTTCLSQGPVGINFTTGPMTWCWGSPYAGECLVSDFAVILGVWSSFDTIGRRHIGHAVDCKIQKGSVEIRQNGTGMPHMLRETFLTTTTRMEISSPEWFWQSSYRIPRRLEKTVKPYLFSSKGGMVKEFPMTEYLLSNNRTGTDGPEDWYASQLGTNDTQRVARAIEANIDMATLFAFAHAPHASPIDITETHQVSIWTYDARVLVVLVLPFLATILVLSAYWRVQSDEVVIGYDPLGIARHAEEVLLPSLRAMEQTSEGKDLLPMSSGGAYSALEARPSYREAGDRASTVDDIAVTPPPMRCRSTDTDERSDGVVISPVGRDEYDNSVATRRVASEQKHPAVQTRVYE